jgi:ferredoxin
MIIEQLRDHCRRLLTDGTVRVVIGYGQDKPGQTAYPIFVTSPDDVGRLVWNDQCFNNLTVYLTRKETRALGKPAIIVKGCDARCLVLLAQESQIERQELYVIGMACDGVGQPLQLKCHACDVHTPRGCDLVLGQATAADVAADKRYEALEAFLRDKTPEQRMAYWTEELGRCIRCHACRQVCPLCYCERCIADKNRPTEIDTSATRKGNFAWQIVRSFHHAGRCAECDECSRVCPAGIDLALLNKTLARAAEIHFQYRSGMDPEMPPVIGAYQTKDKEEFIR